MRRMRYGLVGLAEGWKRERSLRTQVILFFAGLLILLAVRARPAWLLAGFLLFAVAVAAELINASLEALLDRLHPGHDPEIGAAKDMSSGAVLVINLAAAAAFIVILIVSLD